MGPAADNATQPHWLFGASKGTARQLKGEPEVSTNLRDKTPGNHWLTQEETESHKMAGGRTRRPLLKNAAQKAGQTTDPHGTK